LTSLVVALKVEAVFKNGSGHAASAKRTRYPGAALRLVNVSLKKAKGNIFDLQRNNDDLSGENHDKLS